MNIPPSATFFGAGAIGLPMAVRAASVGPITVVEPALGRRRLAHEAGLSVVEHAAEIPPAEVSVVMVATASQAETVILGDNGLAARMDRGSVIVLMSTVGPDAVRDIASRIPQDGPELIDAPVAGGVVGAEEGRLTIFASGSPWAIDLARTTLEAMGTVVLAGENAGEGQAFKIVNQLLATSQLVVAAEAFAFAEHLGLDLAATFEGVRSGAGQSWMLDTYGPRMLTPPEDISASVGIFRKDSGLVRRTAERTGFYGAMSASADAVFERAVVDGLEAEDASAILRSLRDAQSNTSPHAEEIAEG